MEALGSPGRLPASNPARRRQGHADGWEARGREGQRRTKGPRGSRRRRRASFVCAVLHNFALYRRGPAAKRGSPTIDLRSPAHARSPGTRHQRGCTRCPSNLPCQMQSDAIRAVLHNFVVSSGEAATWKSGPGFIPKRGWSGGGGRNPGCEHLGNRSGMAEVSQMIAIPGEFGCQCTH
jgi:hypothetical protein